MRLTARFHDNLNLWFKLYQLLRLSSRRLSMMVAVLSLAEAVLGITLLYLVKRVVDVVSNQLDAVGRIADAGQVFLYLGLIGSLIVLTAAAQRLAEYARQRQGMEVADYVDRLIHERAVEVDLGFYESPAYHDSLERARAAGSERPAQVITTLAGLFRSFLFLAGVLLIVATLDWRLVPLLLASMVVALLVRLRFTSMLFHWRQRRTQKERRAAYLDWLLTSEHHAKELRIGQLGDELRDRYSRLRREIRGEQLEIEKRKMLAEVGAAAAAALVFLGASTWLVLRVIDGSMGLGDLVLFLLLFRRAETSGREFVSSLSMLYDHKLFLSQLFRFLDVTPRILTPAKPKSMPERAQQGIRFKGISFTYPTSDAPILSNIDFELQPGKVTAVVGENGSGKTSLIKLLCRLYDPDEGCITLDGVNIRDFDPDAYRQLFSVIFQDFARYAETARENIRFGNVSAKTDDPRIAAAADLGGASDFIKYLPKGLDTPLSRLFDDGCELSLGQWQRIALSRSFFPRSQFIIMDEPTSAVDPRAEADLFENFCDRLEGRGALIISHRLSTIRMADRIYVLGNGNVEECGSHDELVANDGQYARLFTRQARSLA